MRKKTPVLYTFWVTDTSLPRLTTNAALRYGHNPKRVLVEQNGTLSPSILSSDYPAGHCHTTAEAVEWLLAG